MSISYQQLDDFVVTAEVIPTGSYEYKAEKAKEEMEAAMGRYLRRTSSNRESRRQVRGSRSFDSNEPSFGRGKSGTAGDHAPNTEVEDIQFEMDEFPDDKDWWKKTDQAFLNTVPDDILEDESSSRSLTARQNYVPQYDVALCSSLPAYLDKSAGIRGAVPIK